MAVDRQMPRVLAEVGLAVTAENFARLRVALGLEQRDAARLLDYSPEHVCRWERGRRPIPRCVFAILLAAAREAALGYRDVLDTLDRMARR